MSIVNQCSHKANHHMNGANFTTIFTVVTEWITGVVVWNTSLSESRFPNWLCLAGTAGKVANRNHNDWRTMQPIINVGWMSRVWFAIIWMVRLCGWYDNCVNYHFFWGHCSFEQSFKDIKEFKHIKKLAWLCAVLTHDYPKYWGKATNHNEHKILMHVINSYIICLSMAIH